MSHPDFTPVSPTAGHSFELFAGVDPDPDATDARLVESIGPDWPVTFEHAIEAVGYEPFYGLAQRGLLRIEFVDGAANLVHRVDDPPKRGPMSFAPRAE